MTKPNLAQLTEILHASFSEGALDRCLTFASPDVEIVFQAANQTFRGHDGMMQFMQGFRTAFPDIQLRHTNILVDGDRVAVEFAWVGTHKGPLRTPTGDLPATGKAILDGRVAEILTWKDGKLVRLVNYQDFGSILRTLGLA